MGSQMKNADERIALSAESAAQLAGVSMRRLRYWQDAGLIVPSMQHSFGPRNTVRLYAFPDLVDLCVAAQLRDRFSLQEIQRVVRHLRTRGYGAPLRELRFASDGKRMYFQHPDGSWEDGRRPDQTVIPEVIDLVPIVTRVRSAARRSKADAGRVVSRRRLLGSKPVFAGTRIPVETVLEYLKHGYTTAEVLTAFPALTEADVETARKRLGAA